MNSSRRILIGQVAGQLALVAAIPVLTRLVSLEQMGVYQYAFSLALVLQPLASLRLELVIPTSDGDRLRRRRLLGLILPAAAALAGLIGAGVALALGAQLLAESVAATAVLMLSLSIISIENAVLIRLGRGDRLALRNLLAGVLSAAAQIAVAFFIPSGLVLALALLGGRLIATLVTAVRGSVLTPTEGAESAARSAGRVVSAVASGVVSNAASQAIVVATFVALGPAAAGLVGIAQRVAGTPTTLLGQALSQVMIVQAAPLIRRGQPQMQGLVRRQGLRTAAFAGLCAVGLVALGPLLAGPLLGAEWADAGLLIAIFAIPLSLQLTTIPLSNLLIPLGREHGLLVVQGVRFGGIVSVLVLTAMLTGDLYSTALATAIVWTLSYLALIGYTARAAKAHDEHARQIGGRDDPEPPGAGRDEIGD